MLGSGWSGLFKGLAAVFCIVGIISLALMYFIVAIGLHEGRIGPILAEAVSEQLLQRVAEGVGLRAKFSSRSP